MYSFSWFLFTQNFLFGLTHVGMSSCRSLIIITVSSSWGWTSGLFPVFAVLNHVAVLVLIYVLWYNCAEVFMRCYKPMSGLLGFMLCI